MVATVLVPSTSGRLSIGQWRSNGGNASPRRNHQIDPGQAGEQSDQRRLHLHDYPQPTRFRAWRITAELHRVAESLLCMDQQRLPLCRFTPPLRLHEVAASLAHLRRLPAPFVFCPSCRQIPLGEQYDPEIAVRLWIGRLQLENLAIAGDRIIQSLQLLQGGTHVKVGVHVVRLQRDGVPVPCDRLRWLPQFPDRNAKVEGRLDVVRLERESFAVARDRLLRSALFQPGGAEIVVRLRVVRPEGDRPSVTRIASSSLPCSRRTVPRLSNASG